MYKRKTTTEAELSAARSRAARMRKNCRGGRPKGWRKNPNGMLPRTVAIDPLDFVIIKNYAAFRGMSVRGVFNLLGHALVNGGTIPPRPQLAPEGWSFKG